VPEGLNFINLSMCCIERLTSQPIADLGSPMYQSLLEIDLSTQRVLVIKCLCWEGYNFLK